MTEKFALITGAAGYSATWVIRQLLHEGWRIRVTDLPYASRESLTEFEGKIEYIPADITKIESITPLFADIDVVFHPAALFSYSSPIELLRKVNVEGTKNMLEMCLKSNVKKMVMWSSIAVYGNADPKFYTMPIKELPLEKMNPKNDGKYNVSKREQEELAHRYWIEHKFPISYMRLAPLYGPGSYYGLYALFRYINDEVLTICPSSLGCGKASIPMVHAHDVAKAALWLSDPSKFNGEAYNLADDYTLDLIETISYVANLTGSKFRPIMPVVPMKLLSIMFKMIGAWSSWEARHLRAKIDGRPPLPGLESDLLVYLDGNFMFDNTKIKDTGFKFTYPDRKLGLVETVNYYNQFGWYKKMAIKGSELEGKA